MKTMPARFKMLNWKLYTSTDMVNWTDHGTVASLATFPWAVQTNDAWAPQVIERNGKFYLYAPISVAGWPKNVIAVAVADSPFGPFKDALGHPLIAKAVGNIDPTVFIDDDGQAYLYWGNPNLWYVKLNKDMISYSGEIVKVDSKPENYQEGPWFYKHNGKYYMAYASHCCPEGIGYAMSNSPTGPWEYKGLIMAPDPRSSGNHPGIIDYKGSSYVFGFNYKLNFALTATHRERRSVCAAKFAYNPDGTITTAALVERQGCPTDRHSESLSTHSSRNHRLGIRSQNRAGRQGRRLRHPHHQWQLHQGKRRGLRPRSSVHLHRKRGQRFQVAAPSNCI